MVDAQSKELLIGQSQASTSKPLQLDVYVLINHKCTTYKVTHRQVQVDPTEKRVLKTKVNYQLLKGVGRVDV